MWEMLVGTPPFSAKVHRELLNAHVAKPPPLQQMSHLPASLQAVVARLLMKDREARFADAGALVRALERCRELVGRGETASEGEVVIPVESLAATTDFTAPTPSVPSRDSQRSKMLAAVAALFVLGVAVWWLGIRRGEPAGTASTQSATGLPTPSLAPVTVIPERSIAVLPFQNLGGDRNDTSLVDAMQEEIMTELSQIANLKISSRSAVMRYRAPAERSPSEIGRDLGVAYVLEGTVQQLANTMRLTAHLVDTRTNTQVWSQRLERNLSDVTGLQSEFAAAVAKKLDTTFSTNDRTSQSEGGSRNPHANELYRRAVEQLQTIQVVLKELGMKDARRSVMQLLEEAIQKDPDFLQAHSQLVHVASELAQSSKGQEQELYRGKAESALAAAKRLSPKSGDAHFAEAYFLFRIKNDLIAARKEAEKAVEAQPNHVPALALLGHLYRGEGRDEEALQIYRRAYELSPNDVIIVRDFAETAQWNHQLEVSRKAFERAANLIKPPQSWELQNRAGLAEYARTGDMTLLRATFDRILSENPGLQTEQALLPSLWGAAKVSGDAARMEQLQKLFPAPQDPLAQVDALDRQIALAEARGNAAGVRQGAREMLPIVEAELVRRSGEKSQEVAGLLAMAACSRALLGDKEGALRDARRAADTYSLNENYRDAMNNRQAVIPVRILAGDFEGALDELEFQTSRPSDFNYGDLKHRDFDPLRGHPRFKALEERLSPKSSDK